MPDPSEQRRRRRRELIEELRAVANQLEADEAAEDSAIADSEALAQRRRFRVLNGGLIIAGVAGAAGAARTVVRESPGITASIAIGGALAIGATILGPPFGGDGQSPSIAGPRPTISVPTAQPTAPPVEPRESRAGTGRQVQQPDSPEPRRQIRTVRFDTPRTPSRAVPPVPPVLPGRGVEPTPPPGLTDQAPSEPEPACVARVQALDLGVRLLCH